MHFRQYIQQIYEITSAFCIHTVFSQEMHFFLVNYYNPCNKLSADILNMVMGKCRGKHCGAEILMHIALYGEVGELMQMANSRRIYIR